MDAVANTPGGVAGVVLAADGIANDVVQIVNAAQPQILAEVIPATVGALGVAGGIVGRGSVAGGGGYASSAPAAASQRYVEEIAALDPAVDSTMESTPIAAAIGSAAALGDVDLVLEDLQLATRATTVAGPAYVLRFRNQGSTAAEGFHAVVLAGVDGKLTDDAPRALANVASVAAGEVVEVTLRLPASAMQLTGADGRPTAMTRVFVSLDFADAISELDDLNNLAVVEVGALETAMQ